MQINHRLCWYGHKNLFIFLVWGVVFIYSHAAYPLTLNLVASDSNPLYLNAQGDGKVDLLAKQVFKCLGIDINMLLLPAARALMLAQDGLVDGDLFRIAGLETRYPNLVWVPEPWLEMSFIAFTKQNKLAVNSWEDLADWDVAMIRGWRVFENNVKQSRSLLRVNHAINLFETLEKNRVDVILYDWQQGEYYKNLLKMPNVHVAGSPLAHEPIYLYLHKKNAAMISVIANMIQHVKNEKNCNNEQVVLPPH